LTETVRAACFLVLAPSGRRGHDCRTAMIGPRRAAR